MSTPSPTRVAFRHLQALQVGTTVLSENGRLRIQRYSHAVVVTDLTHAGKRGKRCRELRLWDTDMMKSPQAETVLEGLLSDLPKAGAYEAVFDWLSGFVDEWSRYVVGIPPKIEERELRGVDVAPGGFAPIQIETDRISLESGYDSFTIRDKRDTNNLPTCIPATGGGKGDVKAFYRWVMDNQSAIQRMTYHDVLVEMRDAGIRYHDFCAMD